jgi:hypothetical protein
MTRTGRISSVFSTGFEQPEMMTTAAIVISSFQVMDNSGKVR